MTKEDRKENLAYLSKAYPERYKEYKKQLDSADDDIFSIKNIAIFSQRLREERLDQGLTYTDLAAIFNTSRNAIYYFEIRRKTLEHIDKKRNVDTDRATCINGKERYVKVSCYRFWVLALSIILDISPLYMLGYTNDRSFRGVYRI